MRKRIILAIILLGGLALVHCGEREKAAGPKDKLVQIAVWEDCRQSDTLLLAYLNDENPEIRARACYALSLICPEGASADIARLLADPDERVRLEAVFALGLLGDSLYSADLLALLGDSNEEIVYQAVIALGRMGGDTAISELMTFAHDSLPQHRAWATEGLWRARARQSVALLKDLLTDSAIVVEQAATYALRRLADKSAAGNLRFRLRDTIPEIRSYAADGLNAMADSGSLMELANALSREKEWTVQASLLRAVETIGDKRVIKTILNLLSGNQHPLIIALALEVSAKLEITTLVPRIVPFLQSGESYLRGSAILTLARLEGEKALERIADKIDALDWFSRMKTAEAMQYIKTSNSVNLLKKLLRDNDHRVRTAALASLARFDSLDLNDYLPAALEDPDPGVVSAAIDIITEKKLRDYTAQLLEIYEDARENLDFRYSILNSVQGWIVDSQISDPNILRLMTAGLTDRYRAVRNLAVEAFAKIHQDKTANLGSFRTDINADSYGNYYERFQNNPIAEINTSRGQIRVELLYNQAPKTVANFISLVESGFYDGVIFHRVVPNFVIQTGDPHGDGWGGPGYTIRCEYNRHEFARGTMGMAHSGKDTGGSQWFICHSPQPHLNARYTAFGQVLSGIHIVDQILVGDTVKSVDIIYPED